MEGRLAIYSHLPINPLVRMVDECSGSNYQIILGADAQHG
jgi:hypothetical protein